MTCARKKTRRADMKKQDKNPVKNVKTPCCAVSRRGA